MQTLFNFDEFSSPGIYQRKQLAWMGRRAYEDVHEETEQIGCWLTSELLVDYH